MPTLAEAVALLSQLGIGANVELKAVRDREAETGAMATALLSGLWPPQLPALLISSFSQKALAAARAWCAEPDDSIAAVGVRRRTTALTIPLAGLAE